LEEAAKGREGVQLDGFQGGLLGHDLFNIGLETGVSLQQLLPQGTSCGGLDLGAVAWWDTARKETSMKGFIPLLKV
jgi:hypothetical protein